VRNRVRSKHPANHRQSTKTHRHRTGRTTEGPFPLHHGHRVGDGPNLGQGPSRLAWFSTVVNTSLLPSLCDDEAILIFVSTSGHSVDIRNENWISEMRTDSWVVDCLDTRCRRGRGRVHRSVRRQGIRRRWRDARLRLAGLPLALLSVVSQMSRKVVGSSRRSGRDEK